MTTTYRQGDVLLIPVQEIPANLKPQPADRRTVLAHGEVTGHAHAFAPGAATGYADTVAPDIEVSYVEIAQALADLQHEEHDTIPIPAGKYQVIIQTEYTPGKLQRVLD